MLRGAGFSRVPLRNLTQRRYFQPCTGVQYKNFKGGVVQQSLVATIGINQRRNLVFQKQRQNDDLIVRRLA